MYDKASKKWTIKYDGHTDENWEEIGINELAQGLADANSLGCDGPDPVDVADINDDAFAEDGNESDSGQSTRGSMDSDEPDDDDESDSASQPALLHPSPSQPSQQHYRGRFAISSSARPRRRSRQLRRARASPHQSRQTGRARGRGLLLRSAHIAPLRTARSSLVVPASSTVRLPGVAPSYTTYAKALTSFGFTVSTAWTTPHQATCK